MTGTVPGFAGTAPEAAVLDEWPPDTDRPPGPGTVDPPPPSPPADGEPAPGSADGEASPSSPDRSRQSAPLLSRAGLALAMGSIDQSSHLTHAERDAFNARTISITNHYAAVEARPNSASTQRSILVWEYIHREALVATPPPGIDAALDTLLRHRILVLTADRGQGSTTACLYLAHSLAERLGRELPVEQLDLDSGDALADALTGDTGGLDLIDLVDSTAVARTRLDELGGAQATLADRHGYLIVSVPTGDAAHARTRYPSWTHELTRPDGRAVFRGAVGARLPAGLLDEIAADPWFDEQLRAAWPAHAARLGDLAAGSVAGGRTAVAAIRDETRAALADWTEELRAELEKRSAPWERALLMATALLEGNDPGTIVAAARLLIECADVTDLDEPNPLVARSVVRRVADLNDVRVDVRRVTFTRPEFGVAVLPHVWTEHPELRPALGDWLAGLPAQLDGHRDALESLADRTAGLSAHRGAGIAIELARLWVTKNAGSGPVFASRRSLAVRLLTSTCLDPEIGRPVRDQLWQWARYSPQYGLQRVVAEVCGGPYGETFPRNALTRLKHLATREHPDIRQAVSNAVGAIGVHIGPPRLFGYLADWLDQLRPGQAETIVLAVTEILATDRFRAQLGVAGGGRLSAADPTVRFWRAVFDVLPYRLVGEMVGAWLEVAASLPPTRQSRLIEQLVAATADDYRRVGQLIYAARPRVAADSPVTGQIDQLFAQVRTRLDELATIAPGRHLAGQEEDDHDNG